MFSCWRAENKEYGWQLFKVRESQCHILHLICNSAATLLPRMCSELEVQWESNYKGKFPFSSDNFEGLDNLLNPHIFMLGAREGGAGEVECFFGRSNFSPFSELKTVLLEVGGWGARHTLYLALSPVSCSLSTCPSLAHLDKQVKLDLNKPQGESWKSKITKE